MAFAAAFARPWSSPVSAGPVFLWSPPRPFPARLWLAQRRPAAALPRRQAAPQPAHTPLPRLDLELRLLLSRLTALPEETFFLALRAELGRRAWSRAHAAGAPRPADPAWPTEPSRGNDLDKLRARLVAEVDLGLALVETAPTRFSRPVRNVLLARHAAHIGRRVADLLRHPSACALSEELEHLLDALSRRR